MYKAGDQFPIVEEDAVSDSNDARQIEVYLSGTGLPYTFFRPQVGGYVGVGGISSLLPSVFLSKTKPNQTNTPPPHTHTKQNQKTTITHTDLSPHPPSQPPQKNSTSTAP